MMGGYREEAFYIKTLDIIYWYMHLNRLWSDSETSGV